MLDQNFSASNFETIFTQEVRKGRFELSSMSEAFQLVVKGIQEAQKELHRLRSKKKSERTDEEVAYIENLKAKLTALRKSKKDALLADMEGLAAKVNSRDFTFELNTVYPFKDGKQYFVLPAKDRAQHYAMKQLQYNLQRTFKVKQANRHLITSNVKLLLQNRNPYYIIRADVKHFYETIPQDELMKKLSDNTLLSYKSKAFIREILRAYEDVKDTKAILSGKGIPRGIGISALLSEIYMRDIDNTIKNREEVIYYVRYVDDIFMICSSLGASANLTDYYQDLCEFFQKEGLELQPVAATDKCRLVDCTKVMTTDLSYLGYKMAIDRSGKSADVKFFMTDNKLTRIKERIDRAFNHFDNYSRKNLRQARRDLLDALKMIVGNIRLHKAKAGVKTGIYFNNDLLDTKVTGHNDLNELNTYLRGKKVTLASNIFPDAAAQKTFEDRLYEKIGKFDFVEAWENRRMRSLSIERTKAISHILK